LETRLRQRLARGRATVDDTLDLHGYRQDQAHRVLYDFLIRAQARGAKLVLVVTGKGRTAAEPAVLRRAVPLWLEAPELRAVVVGFGEATATHGGSRLTHPWPRCEQHATSFNIGSIYARRNLRRAWDRQRDCRHHHACR
jgi:hypothetical protein